MSTNNFSYENICVVVHDEEESDSFFETDFIVWKSELERIVKGFIPEEKDNWLNNDKLKLGYIPFYKSNGEHYATIWVTYKSGYYVGACLDYIIERDFEGLKTFENKIESKCKAIEKVLRTFGQEVIKVAQFSNGEAVYKSIKR